MARVLVVDDNQVMADMLCLTLGAHGHECMPAYGGLHALDRIVEIRPQVVLLDVMMADMDGFQTLRAIRALPEVGDTPVIFVTAMERWGMEEEMRRAGASGYCPKPVDTAALSALIEQHARKTRAAAGAPAR